MRKCLLAIFIISIASTTLIAETIEWWQFATDPMVKPTIQAIVDDFEKANPDITVNITDLTWSHGHEKIVLAFASGQAPDVVELGSDWIAQFASTGHLEDISKQVEADRDEMQGFSMAEYGDGVYAYPWYLGTRVLYYNNDLVQKAGYKTGYQAVNDTQLRELTMAIRQLGSDTYGWGANSPEKHRLYKKFLPFLWTSKAQILTDDQQYCVLSSNYAISSLEYYMHLCIKTGYLDTQRGIEDAFLDGKIGVVMSGDWLLKRIKKEKSNLNFTTGVFPGTNYPGYSFMGGEFLAVSKQSSKKEAAMKFVKYLCSPENQIRFCKANQSANPSSKTAQKDKFFQDDPNMKIFIQQINMAKHSPVHPRWVEIEAVIEEAVERSLFKKIEPATALLEAQKKIAGILAK